MGALFENAAMLQHHYEIGLGKGQQTVREQDDRALLGMWLRRAEELSQASDDFCLRVQVQRREGIVQYQESWGQRAAGRYRSCQRHALALAAGDADAQFADFRFQAIRKSAQIRTKGST